MFKKLLNASFVTHLAFAFLVANVSAENESLIVKSVDSPKNAISIPMVMGTDDTWQKTKPLFDVATESGDARMKGWLAVSKEDLLMHIIVDDATHWNPKKGGAIWQGDCLQIAIDGLGDGSRGFAKNTQGPLEADDVAFAIALTDHGKIGWTYYSHKSNPVRGALPADYFSVSRTADTTLYTVQLPWSYLKVDINSSDVMGIAVQLNDSNGAKTKQSRGYFGIGADGAPRPGLHQSLIKPFLSETIMNAQLPKDIIWDKKNSALLELKLKHPNPVNIHISLTDHSKKIKIENASDAMIHKRVHITSISKDTDQLKLKISDSLTKDVLFTQDWTIQQASSIVNAFASHLDFLINQEDIHPLFERHLRSVKAITLSEWARLETYRNDRLDLAMDYLDQVKSMDKAFRADAGQWEAYLDGRRSMVMAYTSPHDGTLQYYLFCLPKDWDPEKEYPLFFELHGGGADPSPMRLSSRLSLGEAKSSLSGYSSPKTFAEIQRNGYWVHPYGRGNLGHRGIAEITLFEAFNDVHQHFKIDEDRRYLYGFSMGGGGTFANALQTPDLWAAIAILSGAPREYPAIEVIENLKNTPIWIWCGEDDYLFNRYKKMVDFFEAADIQTLEKHTTPKVAHSYLGEKQEASLNWLQTFTRKRPNEFSYTAVSDQMKIRRSFNDNQRTSVGAWGITMKRNPSISWQPRYECRIDSNTVYINTKGTPQITVDLGENGLDMKTECTVILNGTTVYEGLPKKMNFDISMQ